MAAGMDRENGGMIRNENDRLYEQLQDPDPQTRIRAIRRLAAIADLQAIPELAAVYQREDEKPAVRKAAREALGVFKAIEVALDNNVDVELPDPDAVKEPPISVDALRRVLRLLIVVLVVLVGLDAALFLLQDAPLAPPPAEPRLMAAQLRMNLDQFRQDVDNQQQAWRQFQAIQTLGCDRFSPPAQTSTSDRWITAMPFEEVTNPALVEAGRVFGRAINEFILVANDWTLGCRDQPTSGAEANLARLDTITDEIATVALALDRAEAFFPTVTPIPGQEPTAAGPAGAIPVTLPPRAEPTALLITPDRYAAYIRAMRDRIDGALVGRGLVAQLNQYWQDVRTQGQTFGCGQVLTAESIQNYLGVSPEDAGLDPRLNDIQVTINVGMTLARESLANFQQACAAGNFSTLVELGQPQAQQAQTALQQASDMLDRLQGEIRLQAQP